MGPNKGYSGTPLLKKIGIKPGNLFLPVHEPDHYFDLLGELPEQVRLVRKSNPDRVDVIHLFAVDAETLNEEFPALVSRLDREGMFWVSWIKKSSNRETDISETEVRALGLELGLVDVKICAVDEDWSGLKFVYRKRG